MTKDYTKGVGVRLIALRKAKKISQDKLAELSGVPRNTIAKIENSGSLHPKPSSIAAMAKHVGATYEYLMFGITDVDTFSPEFRAVGLRVNKLSEEKQKRLAIIFNDILDLA